MRLHSQRSTLLIVLILVFGISSCSLPNLGIRERLRPVRKYLNKDRNYWTDKIEYKGDSGTELIYYKNGRPALERFYGEDGLLQTVSYLSRAGTPVRLDSLVYSDDEQLIAGYYFSEPEHRQILKFLIYQQQGQLSQRSWFGSEGELLSREFFLFDRNGNRRMRMIFDGEDTLLYTETFKSGGEEFELKNAYTVDGRLKSQTRYTDYKSIYHYDFDKHGSVTAISQLHDDGSASWTSDLFYDAEGSIERSNFSTGGRFLFTHTGDLEFRRKTVRSWQHPYQPNIRTRSVRIDHQDPFMVERITSAEGMRTLEYRLPKSGALFKRSTFDNTGKALTDTLYSNQAGLQPMNVVMYDSLGQLSSELNYDLSGEPRWRHTWFRNDDQRVIREELTELPNTFSQAVTRFYDHFGNLAISEHFFRPDSFDGSWVFYHGGGINKTLFYSDSMAVEEAWLIRPAGDTVQHSKFTSIDYIKLEAKLGRKDSLLSYRRFTDDGILNWELFFDKEGHLDRETHRKKDGSIYREVIYEPASRIITSSTYAPVGLSDVQDNSMRGELSSEVVTRLNPSGETVQIISKNSSGQAQWEKRYAYRGGLLVKSAQLGSDGKPVVISTYTHNDLGQMLTERAIDKYDSLVHTIENRYDDQQNLIFKTFSSKFTGITSSNRYYYDEMGRLSRNEIIEAQRFIEAVEYAYYPQYLLRIATHYDPAGEVLRKEIENYFEGNIFDIRFTPKQAQVTPLQ